MSEEVERVEEKKCTCHITCPNCGGIKPDRLSIMRGDFWDLWIQKILRNIASMKFQWLAILYVPVIWGMFHMNAAATPPAPWISASLGLTFLGGGFVTLATSRIIARTKLTNGDDNEMDTDK